ncbi:MAG: hypothetical protein AB1896_15895, partial [Thermodesulfobacteriota bacterium]
MNDRLRIILFSIVVLFLTSTVGTSLAVGFLYWAALAQVKDNLSVVAENQARLIETVALLEAERKRAGLDLPGPATLDRIKEAYHNYKALGRTGELLLVRREGADIVFVAGTKILNLEKPMRVPWASPLAEPAR